MNITGMMHVNVNCSDYERSREFYEFLGFKVMWKVPEAEYAGNSCCSRHAAVSRPGGIAAIRRLTHDSSD